MASEASYVPVVLFVLATIGVLFVTASDRGEQGLRIKTLIGKFSRLRRNWRQSLVDACTMKRIVVAAALALLVSYIWVYQQIQHEVELLMIEKELPEVEVGSLVLPYAAFFRSDYIADTGFSKSRKRTRADIAVSGHLWSGLGVRISETDLAKVSKLVGKSFVFSYLTDVKVLKPAIERFMKRLVRNKQIETFKIETFDNRGPYILVVLHAKLRAKDVSQVANGLAQGVYTNLTKTNKLKVNRVVIKVLDPGEYANGKKIKVIGRGKAGVY